MDKHTRKQERVRENGPGTLGELIHEHVRWAIEQAVHEELLAALERRPGSAAGLGGATATARSHER